MSTSSEWPRHFPAACPPDDARSVDETVYYLVVGEPPTPNDFRSASERGAFAGNPECVRASLSCGLTKGYIMALQKSVPRLRSMFVAAARLEPTHGKIKQTGKPGHQSLWLRAAALVQAPTLFSVVP